MVVLLGIVLVAGVLTFAARTAAKTQPSQAPPAAVVRPCPGKKHVSCGVIKVPLYWTAPRRGSLHVHFKVFVHTDSSRPALEPIVAMEGGPGYPSTGSAASYLFMIGALHRRHDLILMDQRGTGRSDAIDCPGVPDTTASPGRMTSPQWSSPAPGGSGSGPTRTGALPWPRIRGRCSRQYRPQDRPVR